MNFKHNSAPEVVEYLSASNHLKKTERQLAEARSAAAVAAALVSACGDALRKLKQGKEATLQGKVVKIAQIVMIQANQAEASTNQLFAESMAAALATELTAARQRYAEKHEALILKSTIKRISEGKKGVQVVIQIGGSSVTRHLKRTSNGYSGVAFDGNGMMDYDRRLVMGMPTPAQEMAKAA